MKSDQWGTPPWLIELVRKFFGGIIWLDPASSREAQELVKACDFYTAKQNGLTQPWIAKTLWMNPPYSKALVKAFACKFAINFGLGNIDEAVVLLRNDSAGASWYPQLSDLLPSKCLLNPRVAFVRDGVPVNKTSFSSMLLYFGPRRKEFDEIFSEYGEVTHPLLDSEDVE